jgi:hypothetical protein
MHYEIRRGLKSNGRLSTTQRTSGTFAEEPVVLGKVLRRGMRPMLLNEDQFKQHKSKLLRLLLSGSIDVFVVNGESASRMDYKTATGISATPPARSLEIPEGAEVTPVVATKETVVTKAKVAVEVDEEPEAVEEQESEAV